MEDPAKNHFQKAPKQQQENKHAQKGGENVAQKPSDRWSKEHTCHPDSGKHSAHAGDVRASNQLCDRRNQYHQVKY